MKKRISVLIASCLVLLSFSVVGCMDRAMAPKEDKPAAAAAPATAPAPAAEPAPAAPATK